MNADIVVAGSGIAASAAMLYLRQSGYSVIQIAPPEKASEKIGETLSCSANRIIKELGILELFLSRKYLIHDTVFSAWENSSLTRQSRFSAGEGSNWSIDRRDFEDFLRSHANHSHQRRLLNKIQNCSENVDGLSLELDDHTVIQARFVIDCSGRSAVIGRRFSQRHRVDNMICYYNFIKQSDTEIDPTIGIMVEAVAYGWWYSAVLPDNRMIISLYTYPDLVPQHLNRDLKAWLSVVYQAPLTSRRVESAGYLVQEAPVAVDAGMLIQEDISGRHWVAAGDALVSLDPLSSHGMTQALWSGCRAAEACIKSINGDYSAIDQLRQTMSLAIKAYQTELLQKYRSVQRYAEEPFWKRRGSLIFPMEKAPGKAGT